MVALAAPGGEGALISPLPGKEEGERREREREHAVLGLGIIYPET